MNEARIIGIVNFRSIQRDRRDAAFIEFHKNWMAGIDGPFVRYLRLSGRQYATRRH